MPINKLKLIMVILLMTLPQSGCGTINVQASGGGASGFASLGAIILGTSALRYVRGTDHGPRHDDEIQPPDTDPDNREGHDKSGRQETVEHPERF